MRDASVGSFLLADTATSVQRFVSVFVGVYVLLSLVYVSRRGSREERRPRSSGATVPVRRLEPYLRLFRRFIPPLGPIDLSPIIAVFTLFILERLVNALIERVL